MSTTEPPAEDLLAAEQLKIRVLDPAVAERLVGQVVHGLQDRETGHQPGRQRRVTGRIGAGRPELRLQKPPVDRPPELRQRVTEVHDLIEPGAEQIALPAVATLFGRMPSSPIH